MVKYALNFYKYNKRMTKAAVFSVLLGMVTLVVTLLLVRGSMMTEYEDGLCSSGNYNYIALHITEEQYSAMKNNPAFAQVGVLREEGTAELADGSVALVSADEESMDIYHPMCLKGSLPEKEKELAAPESFFIRLGIRPVIGDTVNLSVTYDGEETQQQYVICGILDNIDRNWDNASQSEFTYPEVFVGQNHGGEILCALMTEAADEAASDMVYTFLEDGGYVYCYDAGKASIEASFITNAQEMSQGGVAASMGTTKKRFESAILIPLFSLVISLLVVILVFCSFKSLYQKRMKTFSLMGLWGMSRRTMLGCLLGEFGVILLVSIVLGLIMGVAVYECIFLLQCLDSPTPLQSGLAVNRIIKAVTIPPFLYAASVIFFSSLFAMIAVIGYLELPSVSGKGKKRKIPGRRKPLKSYAGQLACLMKIKKGQIVAVAAVVSVIFMCIYFGSLFIYAKYDGTVSMEKDELNNLGLTDLDYLANKNFYLAQFETCSLNRHDRGVTNKQYQRLLGEEAVEKVQAVIEIPGLKVIEDNPSGALSMYSVSDYVSYAMGEEIDRGYGELIEKAQKKQGYSMAEYENTYNIPMLAASVEDVKQKYGRDVVSGSIHEEKINRGEEVVLVMADDGTKPEYEVGDRIHFTDLKIADKDIEDYNFSSRNIPDWVEPDFTYDYYYDETGETVKQDAYAFGSRWDFEAVIGAVVKKEDFFDDFYGVDNLLPEQAGMYFVTSTDGLKNFGVSDHNYTKLGVKLKEHTTKQMEESFEKTWYSICNADTDMDDVSSKQVRDRIRTEQKSHFFVVVLLFVILMIFSYFMIRAYIKIKKTDCQGNLELLSYLGCRSFDITGIFLRILLLAEGAACLVGWVTIYFYERRILNIYRLCGSPITMRDLLEGNAGMLQMNFEIGSQLNMGGFINLFQYPYIRFYIISLLVEAVVIALLCVFGTKDIVFSNKRRKNHVRN